jgi:hypothetical protein
MWKKFRVALGVAVLTGVAACAAPSDEYRTYPPDDYHGRNDHGGYNANDNPAYGRAPDTDRNWRDAHRDGTYHERTYQDRDGDGVMNWRDRYPDDPRRF